MWDILLYLALFVVVGVVGAIILWVVIVTTFSRGFRW